MKTLKFSFKINALITLLSLILIPAITYAEDYDEVLMKPHDDHYGVRKLPEITPPIQSYEGA